jgi:predicted nuclease with TOPRIM domain
MLAQAYCVGTVIMSDDLVLTLLRRIREDISELKTNGVEVKERLGLLEGQYAPMSRRLDRIGGDVERIKTRLELVEEV